ncbi:predicted protein [Coccidioides posadasii str. Silveira]|uniref:Predicted protein n=1 Tax=Coccidioides posadasii (strain RMSCC 757 / Silveira) TaxID=443226 RepID=E9DGS1_COCPS|nr:predicted protein [Coccidioides posadasii str. Silveira]
MPWMLLLIPGELEAFKSSEMVSLSKTMKGKKPSPPHFIGKSMLPYMGVHIPAFSS